MVSDLQADNNRSFRLFEKFSIESKAVTISSVSLVISILALILASLISVSAWSDAKDANSKVDREIYETRQEMVVLKNQMRLTDVYLQENHLKMEQAGLDPVPIPEN